MGLLTSDMKRVVEEQRLGFFATVCPDGTPNLSPKGTTAVWDDDHLVFANIRSPVTLANLRRNANVEVNVVDPIVRKGYRFKGVATILESGPLYDEAIAFYKKRGTALEIFEVVLVTVQSAKPVTSPAYESATTGVAGGMRKAPSMRRPTCQVRTDVAVRARAKARATAWS
ncbi:MAG TPA: pyridoxamine 5'-phosphate oxidase family protein, partial [Blastocatellia bacterium]|nr:pyridoxamine 5'-phosphate oxidase family protein [Blastocatellia bacterium]